MSDNPFPSMTNTEYALLKSMIREEAREGSKDGAEKAISEHLKGNCTTHVERTEHLEVMMFGRREEGIIGMDEMVATLTTDMHSMRNYLTWLKVTLTASLLSLVVGLAAIILGR